MKVIFIGTRKADFTMKGAVTGFPYYVQPGEPMSIDDNDAKVLLETDARWQAVETRKTPRKDDK